MLGVGEGTVREAETGGAERDAGMAEGGLGGRGLGVALGTCCVACQRRYSMGVPRNLTLPSPCRWMT